MRSLRDLEALERLYAERGGHCYGEGVTQIEHAVQCAELAEADGAPPSLIAAALLHDVGHLLSDDAAPTDQARDHRHEIVGAQALKSLFGPAVRGPIALHVAAKRYLCFADRAYAAALSPASRASLLLQGGAFNAAGAAAFERTPYWRESLTLRRYDEAGKRDEGSRRTFADFMILLRDLTKTA